MYDDSSIPNVQVVPSHLGCFRFAFSEIVQDAIRKNYARTKAHTQDVINEEKVPKTQNHCKCTKIWKYVVCVIPTLCSTSPA